MGSSSGGFPFQQSSSRQRQPDNRHWRYISGEDTPENWPAAVRQTEEGKKKKNLVTLKSRADGVRDNSELKVRVVRVTCEVCVVGGLDEVVGYRLSHVLTLGQRVLHDHRRLGPHQEEQEALRGNQICRWKRHVDAVKKRSDPAAVTKPSSVNLTSV